MSRRRILILVLAGLAIFLIAGQLAADPGSDVLAAPPPQIQATPTPSPLSIADETCLACHNNPNLTMALGNGELLSLFVPADLYANSLHGKEGYACVQCHTTVGDYPHPPFEADNAREASLMLNESCERCHASFAELTHDSVHEAALQAGNPNAAVCVDCHAPHDTQRLTDPETRELLPEARVSVPQTCAKCHYAIYQKYSTSVHGAALLEETNTDVPTCIDCHGVHNIEDPTTTEFRLNSPEICAECHTDAEKMEKYGLSTQVLDTYVADFHGTTVTLFEKQHPDQETNMPVCYDCHGIHDIKRTSDPQKGLQVRQNLLAQCQVCHPDATENFPDAWLSHYIPSPEKNPLVFSVELFYDIFIPVVLGGMAVLVVLDAGTWIRIRIKNRKTKRIDEQLATLEKQSMLDKISSALPSQSEPENHGRKGRPTAESSDPEYAEISVNPAKEEPAVETDAAEETPTGSEQEEDMEASRKRNPSNRAEWSPEESPDE